MAHIDIPPGDEPERIRMWQMVPPMNEAIGAFREAMYTHRTLTIREVEAARMRVAQINECDI
ncbi:MAG: hypothetical protein OXH53_09065 [bacterium]|nr:hypothetical protein [bacterium]MCY3632329.1 hypothetical protein [bacterium]